MLSSRLSVADALGSIDMTEHEVRFLANINNDRERSSTPLLIGRDLAESAPRIRFRSRECDVTEH
jgi:hypothetical protein